MNETTTSTDTASSSTSTSSSTAAAEPAGAELLLEHSADGTLLHGTSHGDRELIDLVKAQGFRWSRNLGAWFLPRAWSEPTRRGRVWALAAQLGERLEVDVDEATPQRSAAEREVETQARAAARADRLEERAGRASAEAEAQFASERKILDPIPFGQPILAGHHSQRRHERALEKAQRHLERGIDATKRAEAAAAGAERARRTAAGAESVVTIGNRIERVEAELRDVRRRLEGTGKAYTSHEKPAGGSYRVRLRRREAELVDQLEHDQAKLAAAGGVTYSREIVAAGDLVRVRGIWYPVVRVNAKSVSVPSPMAAADSSWTNTAPYREIQDHLPQAEATGTKVRNLAATTARAFEGLKARLEAYADQLDERDELEQE